MAFQFIEVKKKDRITTITINRPEVMNALHPPASRELDEAFNAFEKDASAWVAILTGTGSKAFCAGNDFKWQSVHGKEAVGRELAPLKGGFGGITSRIGCHKPMIAAVNGAALGGGLSVVLACDIVVAAESAVFGLPGPRLGTMTKAGGIHRLLRQIPYHLAMGLILTGRHISAWEAYRMGMINEVVPDEELISGSRRWASEILACAPLAIRASKQASVEGLHLPLKEAMERVFPATTVLEASEDQMEGQTAFVERRKPLWKRH